MTGWFVSFLSKLSDKLYWTHLYDLIFFRKLFVSLLYFVSIGNLEAYFVHATQGSLLHRGLLPLGKSTREQCKSRGQGRFSNS